MLGGARLGDHRMKALVPLDGSELALSVLTNVRRLAELAPGLEVHLLTVLDPKAVHGRTDTVPGELTTTIPGSKISSVLSPAPRVVESHGEALERVHLEANEALQQVADRDLSGVATSCAVVFSSNPAEAIVEQANEWAADLIIMATHGRSGITHLLAGSVTEAVIKNAGKPVLVNCPKPD
ncbi:MAG: hypothetical protein C0506_04745 [Anaerolinea sp.]|nr:hypothetical protein [Anaerolinea sp.]